jgi:hypothetical protein
MFKNIRALSALVGFIALLFVVFNFAACGSEGSIDPGDKNSSASTYQPGPIKVDTTVTVGKPTFEVGFVNRNTQEDLEIRFQIKITIADESYGNKFDSVLIKLQSPGKIETLNSDKGIGKVTSYGWDTTGLNVNRPELCGVSFRVCYEVFAKKELRAADCEDITREERICKPSSSSAAPSSSSAVVSKQFVQVGTGTVTINSNAGVMLNNGATASADGADLYFSGNELRVRNNFKITEYFSNGWSCENLDSSHDVANPENTSQFIYCNPRSDFPEEPSAAYIANRYYLVKSGGTEWGPNWYLVMSNTTPMVGGGVTSIDIKIWKVN